MKIDLLAKATKTSASDQKAEFNAGYEAKFEYPAGVTEAEVLPQLDKEFYQYMLVAQAFSQWARRSTAMPSNHEAVAWCAWLV